MTADYAELAPWVAHAASEARIRGRTPIAILDVDLTLVDNAPRNRAIWASWLHGIRGAWPGASAAALRAQTMPIVFGVRENLAALGVKDPALVELGFRYWLDAFFTPRFAAHDVALAGAVDAALALRNQDVTLVYLTARPIRLHAATVEKFGELGLPLGGPGTLLVMKDSATEGDGAFKTRALDWIGALGHAIVCVDNEPAHVNAMHLAFPAARAVQVETRCSADAPPLASGVHRAPSVLAALQGGL